MLHYLLTKTQFAHWIYAETMRGTELVAQDLKTCPTLFY